MDGNDAGQHLRGNVLRKLAVVALASAAFLGVGSAAQAGELVRTPPVGGGAPLGPAGNISAGVAGVTVSYEENSDGFFVKFEGKTYLCYSHSSGLIVCESV